MNAVFLVLDETGPSPDITQHREERKAAEGGQHHQGCYSVVEVRVWKVCHCCACGYMSGPLWLMHKALLTILPPSTEKFSAFNQSGKFSHLQSPSLGVAQR